MNRPGQLNAINEVMRDDLTAALAEIAADASVNVVVLFRDVDALLMPVAVVPRHSARSQGAVR